MNHGIKAWGLLIFLSVLWGSSFFLMKTGLLGLSPLQIAGLRLTVAALCLLPWAIAGLRKMDKKLIPIFFLTGLTGNLIPAFLFPKAEEVVPSAVAGILNALSPVWILVIALIIFQKKFAIHRIVGIAIGLGGAVLLVLAGKEGIDFTRNVQFSLLIVLATFCYGISANLISEYFSKSNPVTVTAFSLASVGIPAGIWLFTAGGFVETVSAPTFPWISFWSIFALGSLGTAFALVLFTRLLQLTDVVFSSSVTYLIPIVALVWGIIDGESIHWMQFLGLGIVISGVYLVNRKK